MNGMDGVTIDREKVGSIARGSFGRLKTSFKRGSSRKEPHPPMLMQCWTNSGLFCMAWLRYILIVLHHSIWSAHNTACSLCWLALALASPRNSFCRLREGWSIHWSF
jgi:hypothetical protein